MFQRFQIGRIALLAILLFTFSCKNETSTPDESVSVSSQDENKISSKDIEALDYTEYVLSNSAENVTGDWLKFQELNTYMDLLKRADYSFFSEDEELLKTFVGELTESLPERLNEASIIARLLALETNMYKLHNESIINANDKPELLNAIKEVLVGYTNLVFQINKKLEKDDLRIERPQ